MDWNEFLSEAIAEKDAGLVREALAQGADPNRMDEDWQDPLPGHSPLFWAVSGGSLEIARLLLNAGARVTAEAKASSSSLHAAVEDANLLMVNLLLEHDGAAALNGFDYVERTPLMIAAEMDSIPVAGRLIEAGADVNAHEDATGGDTALHIVARNGTLRMAELLVSAGADPLISTGLGEHRLAMLAAESAATGRAFVNCWNRRRGGFRDSLGRTRKPHPNPLLRKEREPEIRNSGASYSSSPRIGG